MTFTTRELIELSKGAEILEYLGRSKNPVLSDVEGQYHVFKLCVPEDTYTLFTIVGEPDGMPSLVIGNDTIRIRTPEEFARVVVAHIYPAQTLPCNLLFTGVFSEYDDMSLPLKEALDKIDFKVRNLNFDDYFSFAVTKEIADKFLYITDDIKRCVASATERLDNTSSSEFDDTHCVVQSYVDKFHYKAMIDSEDSLFSVHIDIHSAGSKTRKDEILKHNKTPENFGSKVEYAGDVTICIEAYYDNDPIASSNSTINILRTGLNLSSILTKSLRNLYTLAALSNTEDLILEPETTGPKP